MNGFLIFYDLTGLSGSSRSTIFSLIKGYKTYYGKYYCQGLVEKYNIKKIARGVLFVDQKEKQGLDKIINMFKRHKAKIDIYKTDMTKINI